MELNPNHPVTRSLHDSWHKILAIVLYKQGLTEFVIEEKDLVQFVRNEIVIVCHAQKDRIVIKIMPSDQAKEYIKEHRDEK